MDIISNLFFKIFSPFEYARKERERQQELLEELEQQLAPEKVEQPVESLDEVKVDETRFFRTEGVVTELNSKNGVIDRAYMFRMEVVDKNIIDLLKPDAVVVYLAEKSPDEGHRVIRVEDIKQTWGDEENDVSIYLWVYAGLRPIHFLI